MTERHINITMWGRKYTVTETDDQILGWCDIPGDDDLEMVLPAGDTFKAFRVALHEAGHAVGIPTEFWDEKDDKGMDRADYMAKMLKRLWEIKRK